MALSNVLNAAQSSLRNIGVQTGTVSRNIGEVGNPDFGRRSARTVSSDIGARIELVRAQPDVVLAKSHLTAVSGAAAQTLLAERSENISLILHGDDGRQGAASMLDRVAESLQIYSSTPSDNNAAFRVVADAKALVGSLQDGAEAVHAFRIQADADIAADVSRLRELLVRFEKVNTRIVEANLTGRDAFDAQDQKTGLLADINGIIPVNIVAGKAGDTVLVTKGGATLFETVPRAVFFSQTGDLSSGQAGASVTIDGVALKAVGGSSRTVEGTLNALLYLRDETAPELQAQLDGLASGLVRAFAEQDQTGAGGPEAVGLLTWAGAPSLPVPGPASTGIAASIAVNAAFDPASGGDPVLLRDGGANGGAYLYNATGAASFSTRIVELSDALNSDMSFGTVTALDATQSVMSFAASSIGWLDGFRAQANADRSGVEADLSRLSEKMSNATGVNIDEELTLLLQFERSYEASARLIGVVDEMLATLFAAVR